MDKDESQNVSRETFPEVKSDSEVSDLAVSTYERLRSKINPYFRARRREQKVSGSLPFASGRDPEALGQVLQNITEERGWNEQLDQEDLIAAWPKFVGEEISAQTLPKSFQDGVLFIECRSTAWATQLRLIRTRLISHLQTEFPHSGIENIRFIQPSAPSWKKGMRTVPGRGPRDTYG